jgi:hypothetical protein
LDDLVLADDAARGPDRYRLDVAELGEGHARLLQYRAACFSAPAGHARVFLDPDTGIRLEACGGVAAPGYVLGDEQVRLCRRAASSGQPVERIAV